MQIAIGLVLEELLGAGNIHIQREGDLGDVDEVAIVHVLTEDVVAPGAAALRHGRAQSVGGGTPGVGRGLVHQHTGHGDALGIVLHVSAVVGEDTGRVADAAGLFHVLDSHGHGLLEGLVALEHHDGPHDLLVQHVGLAHSVDLQS